MKPIWTISAMVAGALILGSVLVVGHDKLISPPAGAPGASGAANDAAAGAVNVPWVIQTPNAHQTHVLGLTLGADPSGAGPSTMQDVQRLWGIQVDVAVIAAPGETGALEAFIDPVQAGPIGGKLIIHFDVPASVIAGLRERAVKSEFMESTTRKYTLSGADLAQIGHHAISSLAFVPQANLDEDMVVARFGTPAERRQGSEGLTHLMYPDKGLDVALNAKGKDVLQYVARADFHKLREPLVSAGSAASRP